MNFDRMLEHYRSNNFTSVDDEVLFSSLKKGTKPTSEIFGNKLKSLFKGQMSGEEFYPSENQMVYKTSITAREECFVDVAINEIKEFLKSIGNERSEVKIDFIRETKSVPSKFIYEVTIKTS